MKFQDLEDFENQDAEAAVERDDPEELVYVLIGVSMTAPDFEWTQGICVRLALHSHPNVHALAVEGFGHIARRFGRLNEAIVRPLIESALSDRERWVRMKAYNAASDIQHFLNWHFEAIGNT